MVKSFYNPQADSEMKSSEIQLQDDEKDFIKIISDEMISILDIRYPETDIVKKLIYSNLINRNFKLLLLQYFNKKLEIVATTIRNKFDIPEDVYINYDNAVHAKLNDILEYIGSDGESYSFKSKNGEDIK